MSAIDLLLDAAAQRERAEEQSASFAHTPPQKDEPNMYHLDSRMEIDVDDNVNENKPIIMDIDANLKSETEKDMDVEGVKADTNVNTVKSSSTTTTPISSSVKKNPRSSLSRSSSARRSNVDSSASTGQPAAPVKKKDGAPLLRSDIQYEFLHHIFNDENRVFTSILEGADETKKYTFREYYIECLLNSGKTPKSLKERMLADPLVAVNVAKTALLVNIGRMNTTLVFMPTQTRTFHAVPSLQVYEDGIRPLQDAPRLKTMLKGSSDDKRFPASIEELVKRAHNRAKESEEDGKPKSKPPCNPTHLCFLLSQTPINASQIFFEPGQEFNDLFSRTTFSSRSRAMAFLYIVWLALETDLQDVKTNPFVADDPEPTKPKVTFLEEITTEQAALENVDTPGELEYGQRMQEERHYYLTHGSAMPNGSGPDDSTANGLNPDASSAADSSMISSSGRSMRHSGRKRRGHFSQWGLASDTDPDLFLSEEDILAAGSITSSGRSSSANRARAIRKIEDQIKSQQVKKYIEAGLERELAKIARRRRRAGMIKWEWQKIKMCQASSGDLGDSYGLSGSSASASNTPESMDLALLSAESGLSIVATIRRAMRRIDSRLGRKNAFDYRSPRRINTESEKLNIPQLQAALEKLRAESGANSSRSRSASARRSIGGSNSNSRRRSRPNQTAAAPSTQTVAETSTVSDNANVESASISEADTPLMTAVDRAKTNLSKDADTMNSDIISEQDDAEETTSMPVAPTSDIDDEHEDTELDVEIEDDVEGSVNASQLKSEGSEQEEDDDEEEDEEEEDDADDDEDEEEEDDDEEEQQVADAMDDGSDDVDKNSDIEMEPDSSQADLNSMGGRDDTQIISTET